MVTGWLHAIDHRGSRALRTAAISPGSMALSLLTPCMHACCRWLQVIIERMDRLKPSIHLTLKVASVMGQWVDLDILHKFYPIHKSKDELRCAACAAACHTGARRCPGLGPSGLPACL